MVMISLITLVQTVKLIFVDGMVCMKVKIFGKLKEQIFVCAQLIMVVFKVLLIQAIIKGYLRGRLTLYIVGSVILNRFVNVVDFVIIFFCVSRSQRKTSSVVSICVIMAGINSGIMVSQFSTVKLLIYSGIRFQCSSNMTKICQKSFIIAFVNVGIV